jgi:hypothetical protein
MLLPRLPGPDTPRGNPPELDTPDPHDPRPDDAPNVGSLRRRLLAEAGEGVISTGIVVLIMALIGAAMWVAFSSTANDAAERVDDSVQNIGSDG